MLVEDLKAELRKKSTSEKAKASAWFFKTGPGQYGEGDVFLGVTVPEQRKIAKGFKNLPLAQVEQLLQSPTHEERLVSLIILVDQFKKADESTKKQIFDFYLKNTRWVNNWDLVDSSAEQIVGGYLLDKDRDILYQLAHSSSLWEKRISIIATFEFIKNRQSEDTLKIAKILLFDKEDLLQKAVGWMLREVGKRCSQSILEAFLLENYRQMPRTSLRYAIEHFPQETRQKYLKGLV